MKKINLYLLLLGVLCLLSCSDDTENKMLRQKITELQEQVVDLQDKVKSLKEELDKCIHGDPNKDIQQIGRWMDTRKGIEKHIITIFRNIKTKKLYMEDEYHDGSKSVEEIRLLNHNGLKRYELIDNRHNEYYVVESNGDLSMYGQGGKFGSAAYF